MRAVRGLQRGLVAAVLLAACTSAPPVPQASPTPDVARPTPTSTSPTDAGRGGTLRYALGSNPASIDPRFLADEEGATVADALFDSLVAIGDDLEEVVPAAAVSWDVGDDGRTYTFQLRPGATFHDGRPVRAGDFVRAFRRIVDRDASPTSFLHYQLAPVVGYDEAVTDGTPLRGVRALDDHTLEVRLDRPSAEFLQVLAHPSLAPIPPDADASPDDFAQRPVGNGPFAMAEAWQPNQFIRVARFEEHHTPPRLDEVVFQIFANDPSRQQQYDDFERGQLDVAEVPPAVLDEAVEAYGRSVDGRSGPGVLQGLTGALYAFGFNTELPPFDDPAARRAVSMLIDRDRIVEQILLGARVTADTLVPPSIPGGASGRCDHCTYDPDAARAELGLAPAAGSTAPDPPTPTVSPSGTATVEPTATDPVPEDPPAAFDTPIEIVVNEGSTNERIAARVAADIESALGVEVTTRTAAPADFVGQLRAGEVQVFRLGWQADYPSPGAVLQPLFHSDGVGQDNLTRFRDDQVDALLDQARTARDPTQRQELYAQAEQRILALAPVAPVYFYRQNRVVADGVVDLHISPLGDVDFVSAWKREPA